jgi:CTP:molybdopterin cytidylyltransferase MocA
MLVGVLLAAGASTRMGTDKALVRKGGMSFLAHGVRTLWHGCTCVVTVIGAGAPRIRRAAEEEFTRLVGSGRLHADLAQAHRHGAAGLELHFQVNPRWRSGMLSSVQAGLHEALALRPEAILVLPVDHPAVRAQTVLALSSVVKLALAACRNAAERRKFSYALVPRYRRRRGHPLALTPALAKAIAADREARDLSDAVRRNARLVGYLDVQDPGIVRNVNRRGD